MENQDLNTVKHYSSKDNDDPILEYRNISIDHLENKKVNLMNIPFYQATAQELLAFTLKKMEVIRNDKEFHGALHVLPLDPYRFTLIRFSSKYSFLAKSSFLNLPASSGLPWMSRRLKKELPEMVSTISYTMNLIRLAHAKEYSIFIVGGKEKSLEKLSFNLKRSFPKLRIVGKHSGYLKGQSAERIIEALKKTDPHIILLGLGYKKELKWLRNYKSKLGNTVILNVGGSLDIMSGKKRKSPDSIQLRGYTWFWRAINNPCRWYRIPVILYWFLQTFYYSIFKKNK